MNNLYKAFFFIAVSITSINPGALAERVVTVDPDPASNADFSNITAALDFLRTNGDVVKYRSASLPANDPNYHKMVVVSGSDIVMAYNYSGVDTLYDIGDLFSVDGEIWYEIIDILTDRRTLQLERPIDSLSVPYDLVEYTVLENNVISLSADSYFEDIVLNNIHFVSFRGAGKTATILHQAGDQGGGNLVMPSCAEILSNGVSNGTQGFLKSPEQYGKIAFENLSIHSNHGGALIANSAIDRMGKTDFSLSNVKFDQSFSNDILFYQGSGNVSITNTELRGTGDGITIFGGNKVTINNMTLHDRYMPCLPIYGPAAVRIATRQPSTITNSTIVVEAHPDSGHQAAIAIGETSAGKTTISNLTLTAFNASPSIYIGANSQIDLLNSRIYSHHEDFDITLGAGSTLHAECTTGINTIDSSNGVFIEACANP